MQFSLIHGPLFFGNVT